MACGQSWYNLSRAAVKVMGRETEAAPASPLGMILAGEAGWHAERMGDPAAPVKRSRRPEYGGRQHRPGGTDQITAGGQRK